MSKEDIIKEYMEAVERTLEQIPDGVFIDIFTASVLKEKHEQLKKLMDHTREEKDYEPSVQNNIDASVASHSSTQSNSIGQREIKFRAWNNKQQTMYYNHSVSIELSGEVLFLFPDGEWKEISSEAMKLMQYTGLDDSKGREVYEGDIYFTEEETDNGDIRELYIVVWIKEWCRFSFLHLPGEYSDYLDNGIEHFDMMMEGSYIIDPPELEGMHYKGNMYENPELLTYKSIYEED